MQQLSIISRQQLILTSPPIQPVKKDRKEYFKQRYQTKKHYWEENYMSKKSQTKEATKKQEKEQMGRYHQANNIKVLMSLKEYVESHPEKTKIFARFKMVLASLKEGVADIIEIMELIKVAEDLQKDYWATAKSDYQAKNKWKLLTTEQQEKKLEKWGLELEQEETKRNTKLSKSKINLESRKQEYLEKKKLLEMEIFHQERGKKGCECWQCEENKEPTKRLLNEKEIIEKVECSSCGRMVKELDEETDACQKCSGNYQ